MSLPRNTLFGVLITLLGSLSYVLYGALSKFSQSQLAFSYLILLQSVVGLSLSAIFWQMQKLDWRLLWHEFHFIYGLRIVVSLASMYTFIYGLQFLNIYNALVILNCCPLFMPLLRFLFFKKKFHHTMFILILIAFMGVVFILAPDQHIWQRSTWIIVVSLLCMAFSVLLLEDKRNSNVNVALFYYFLFSTMISSFALSFFGGLAKVSWQHLNLALFGGSLFFLVQFCMIYAARYISSQLIAVLFYSEIIFALIISLINGSTALSFSLILGTILIISGGMGVIFYESKANPLA